MCLCVVARVGWFWEEGDKRGHVTLVQHSYRELLNITVDVCNPALVQRIADVHINVQAVTALHDQAQIPSCACA